MGRDVSAEEYQGTTQDLIEALSDPNNAVLATIGWNPDDPLTIYHGESQDYEAAWPFSGHVMMLAAYDPSNPNGPWGFVNSWTDGGEDIFWMANSEFQDVWGYEFPGIGSNNYVVISWEEPVYTPRLIPNMPVIE